MSKAKLTPDTIKSLLDKGRADLNYIRTKSRRTMSSIATEDQIFELQNRINKLEYTVVDLFDLVKGMYFEILDLKS